MRKKLLFWVALIAVLVMNACTTATNTPSIATIGSVVGKVVPVDGGGHYIDINPHELLTMLEEKDFFFVNVHIPYEGELPDTDAFIPFDEIEGYLAEFPQDKGAKIVLYCRSGSMSATAAREMVRLGYTNIYNLDGGFRAWLEAGLEFFQ